MQKRAACDGMAVTVTVTVTVRFGLVQGTGTGTPPPPFFAHPDSNRRFSLRSRTL